MIAWTSSGSVPKVGGISADSSTPSRPLVPAPTKTRRPPLRSALAINVGADRDAIALLLDRGEHPAIFVQHQVDDAGGGQFVDVRAKPD